jgi:succinoglycan exporter
MPPRITIKSVTKNVGWSVLSRTATFGLKFVTVPILARILSPEEFGAVAVAMTVVQFLAMIGSAGLAASLVLQTDEDSETVHSVFWVNMILALLMAAGLYAGADMFASLLGAPDAAYLLEIMSLLIPLQLSGDIAYALLARRMSFDKDALWSVVSESLGAIVALVLALVGFGIWALVVQQFVAALVRLVGLYWAARYIPRFVVSFRKIGGLMKYSLGIMGSEIANFVTFQSPLVIVSRHLGLADAGAYSAANRFSSIPNQVVLTALMGVLFPVFSHMMDDRERRTQALMLSTQVSTLILAPMMFGLWAIAEPAMLVLFGSQWAHAWPVLGLLALSKGIMTPCSTFIPFLKGAGEGAVLWWSAAIRAVAVYAAVSYGAILDGLTGAMVALCIVNGLTLIGYSWAVFRTNQSAFFSNFFVTSRPMITSVIMALAVRYLIDNIKDDVPNAIWQVVIGGVVGGIIYGVLALLTERALMKKLVELIRQRRAGTASA